MPFIARLIAKPISTPVAILPARWSLGSLAAGRPLLELMSPGVMALVGALILHQLPGLPAWPSSYWHGSLLAACLLLLGAKLSGRRLGVRRTAQRTVLWAMALLLVFLWRTQERLEAMLPVPHDGLQTELQVRIRGLPIRDESGWRFHGQVLAGELNGKQIQLVWSAGYGAFAGTHLPEQLLAGQHWRFSVKLTPWRAQSNPIWTGPPAPELRALQDGLVARAQIRPSGRNELLTEQISGELGMANGLANGSANGLGDRFADLVDRARARIRQLLAQRLTQDHARASAVLTALVLGDQSAITQADWQRFNRTGIGHLISISGLHVTMVAAVGAWLFVLVWRLAVVHLHLFRPYAERALNRLVAARAGAVLVGGAYCLFAGAEVPAQRTFWMLLALSVITLLRRRCGLLVCLSAAALLVLLLDPWAIASPGFWLSFVATWALMRGSSPSTRAAHTQPSKPAARRWLTVLSAGFASAASAQLLVTLALIPLSAVLFGYFSVISPAANAFAIPLVSFFTTPLALLGAVLAGLAVQVPESLAAVLFSGVDLCWYSAAISVDWLLRALAWIDTPRDWPASLPLAGPGSALAIACLVLSAFGVIGLVVVRSLLKRVACALLLVPVFVPAGTWSKVVPAQKFEGIAVTALDMGSGSALLVRTPDLTVLYDTGTASAASRVLLSFLRESGIRAIDLLVLSHPDREHTGGLESVLNEIRVDKLVHGLAQTADGTVPAIDAVWQRLRAPLATRQLPEMEACVSMAPVQLGATTLRFFSDPSQAKAKDRGCVLSIGWQGTAARRVLLLGDLAPTGQQALLKAWSPAQLKADLVQMPGMGSKATWFEGFVTAVSPQLALVQLTQGHWRGYPHRKAMEPLERARCELLRTDLHGAVRLHLRADGGQAIWRERLDAPRYFSQPAQ